MKREWIKLFKLQENLDNKFHKVYKYKSCTASNLLWWYYQPDYTDYIEPTEIVLVVKKKHWYEFLLNQWFWCNYCINEWESGWFPASKILFKKYEIYWGVFSCDLVHWKGNLLKWYVEQPQQQKDMLVFS